ncbi:MAG: hypothetical protein JPMHGGIA_00546 [Saprospiraceae bacterium]|jgi:hypothetical protein|nr:hypothetical protein [Saprospiraceae bacterium]
MQATYRDEVKKGIERNDPIHEKQIEWIFNRAALMQVLTLNVHRT